MQSSERELAHQIELMQPEIVDLLTDLVRIPSVTGEEATAQHYLIDLFREYDWEVDTWCPQKEELQTHSAYSDDGLPLGERPVVIALIHGAEPHSGSLILNGHIDVVPIGDAHAWRDGPWSGAIRDGSVWGRGSCDMKAGLVSAIAGVLALQRTGLQPRADVLIESVIGEETGGVGTLATLLRGYRADAAIILEPTRLAICPATAGAASFRLAVPGKAAHGALRLEGVSAVEKFYLLMKAVQDLESARNSKANDPLFDSNRLIAPISIGKIASGDWPSTVPESLVAEGRFGILPGERIQDARTQFEAAIAAAADRDPWLCDHKPEVQWFEGQFEPGETSLDAPILSALKEAHASIVGSPPEMRGVPYGSDLRFFTNYAEMDAVLYGPGDVSLAHSLNEHVSIDEVLAAAKVIALTVMLWGRKS